MMMLLFTSVLLCTIGLLPVNAEFNCPVSSDVSNYDPNPAWTASIDGQGVEDELLDSNDLIFVTANSATPILITVTANDASLLVSKVSVKVKKATKVRWDKDATTDQTTNNGPQTRTHTFNPMKAMSDVFIEVFASSEVEIEEIVVIGCLDLGACDWGSCACDGTKTKDQNCTCTHTAFPSSFQEPTCVTTNYETGTCTDFTTEILDWGDKDTGITANIEDTDGSTKNNNLLFNSNIATVLASNSEGPDEIWLDLLVASDVFYVEIWTRYAESVTITYDQPQGSPQTETKNYNSANANQWQQFLFTPTGGRLNSVSEITFTFGYPHSDEIKVKGIWVEVCAEP